MRNYVDKADIELNHGDCIAKTSFCLCAILLKLIVLVHVGGDLARQNWQPTYLYHLTMRIDNLRTIDTIRKDCEDSSFYDDPKHLLHFRFQGTKPFAVQPDGTFDGS